MENIVSCCQGESFRKALHRPWNGRVLLVTHDGWYLETELGQVLLLHDAVFGEIPIGAALPSIQALPYSKQLEHQPAHYEHGQITLPAGVVITLSPSEKRPALPAGQLAPERMAILKSTLRDCGKGPLRHAACGIPAPETGPFQSACPRLIGELLAAVKTGNQTAIEEAVKGALGLGIGLTPSCDDWLVGYLYGVRRAGKMDIWQNVGRAVCRYADSHTNRISAAYLQAAARGEYWELLEQCLFGEGTDSIVRLLHIGSSSGSDMLSGLIMTI